MGLANTSSYSLFKKNTLISMAVLTNLIFLRSNMGFLGIFWDQNIVLHYIICLAHLALSVMFLGYLEQVYTNKSILVKGLQREMTKEMKSIVQSDLSSTTTDLF